MKANFEKGIKKCSTCKRELPLTEFNKDKTKADVLHNQCKGCQAEHRAADRGRYNSYKGNAKQRGYSFNLTKEQFAEIIHKPCTYCGMEDSGGVDRVDNSIGYEIDNCVPCCTICNYGKHTMTAQEFSDYLFRAGKHQNKIKRMEQYKKIYKNRSSGINESYNTNNPI